MKKQEAVNREKDYEKTKRVNKEKKQSVRFYVLILYLIILTTVPFISFAQGDCLWAVYYGGLNPDQVNETDAVFDFSKQSNWQIFPVPAKNEINIRAGSTTGIECVEPYDVLGKKRWSKNYSGIKTNGWQMDISGMAAGIYILKIKTDSECFIQTIAKQ